MVRFFKHLLWRFQWWRISRANPQLMPSDWAISFMDWAKARYDLDAFEVLTSDAMWWAMDQITREAKT